MARRDPHSYNDDTQVETESLHLAARVDFAAKTISAEVTLAFRAPGGGPLDLDTRDLAIESVHDLDGTALAWMTTDDHDYVMMARVPVGNTPTLYARIGNAVVVLAGVYLAVALALSARGRRYMPPYE